MSLSTLGITTSVSPKIYGRTAGYAAPSARQASCSILSAFVAAKYTNSVYQR